MKNKKKKTIISIIMMMLILTITTISAFAHPGDPEYSEGEITTSVLQEEVIPIEQNNLKPIITGVTTTINGLVTGITHEIPKAFNNIMLDEDGRLTASGAFAVFGIGLALCISVIIMAKRRI